MYAIRSYYAPTPQNPKTPKPQNPKIMSMRTNFKQVKPQSTIPKKIGKEKIKASKTPPPPKNPKTPKPQNPNINKKNEANNKRRFPCNTS